MGRPSTRTITKITTQEGDATTGKEDDDASLSGCPLFATHIAKSGQPIEKIAVFRMKPHEGWIGTIPAGSTEEDIREQWGGGTYSLRAYSAGKIVKHHEVVIAGDPRLQGRGAQADWYRARGLPNPDQPNHGGVDLGTLLTFFREQGQESRRAEVDSVERRRQLEADAEARRQEAEDRRRRWEMEMEEKRRGDDLAREERRRRDDEARDRRREQDEERRAREQREFQLQMLGLQQSNSAQTIKMMEQQMENTMKFMSAQLRGSSSSEDPTAAIMRGVELVRTVRDTVGGEQEKDLLTSVVESLPEITRGVLGEIRGNPGKPAGSSSGQSAQAPSSDQQAEDIARRLISEGRDPAEWFGHYTKQLTAMKEQAMAQKQQSQPQQPITVKFQK